MSILFLCGALACDPCRQLADLVCTCEQNTDKRKKCHNELGLASQHVYFDQAKETQVCEEALKNCLCVDLNNGKSEKCGMSRFPIK
jgi:hypothetical protein